MALNKVIITPTEADVFLALEAAWLLLTDPIKTDHIAKASVYMQTKWTCSAVDWDDDTTITDEQKEACAYYALADSNGNLYYDPTDTPSGSGNVIEETKKAGSLQKTVKYSDNNLEESSNLLQYPNTLMGVECASASSSGAVDAIRT